MASLVLKMSVSLDGFVAPIDGSSDWAAAGRSDDGAGWVVETLSNAGAHLIGAATYEASSPRTPAERSSGGRDDDLVPWSNNQYLDDLPPNSEIHPLDAGHRAWEEATDDYGRLIAEWYRRLAS